MVCHAAPLQRLVLAQRAQEGGVRKARHRLLVGHALSGHCACAVQEGGHDVPRRQIACLAARVAEGQTDLCPNFLRYRVTGRFRLKARNDGSSAVQCGSRRVCRQTRHRSRLGSQSLAKARYIRNRRLASSKRQDAAYREKRPSASVRISRDGERGFHRIVSSGFAGS